MNPPPIEQDLRSARKLPPLQKIPILLMRKERLREANYVFLGHTSGTNIKSWIQCSSMGIFKSKLVWV